ncbi:hypothetical protein [Anaerocolumna sp. MB42-C2]|uniref:hypothetical protein n=1 Tax=Anaerocolumna sp. MB42-C2 TaxID=3070997 RepID=UPI0027E0E477|nr:hypothetical protein [Anaerocolumna sp. MB42-C2]WMJ90474.1 hypothetical protein RBU59_13345 [Anaerocolumna sp. MB42-C2]
MSGTKKVILQQDNMDRNDLKKDEFLMYLQEALLLVLTDEKIIDRYQLDEYILEKNQEKR